MSKFIAGQYTATYATKAVGQTADGYRMSHSFFKRLVTGDLAGDTPQDGIYRGREQMIGFTIIEADEAAVADIVEPYADTSGDLLELGKIGIFDIQGDQGDGGSPSARPCKQLVLTAVTGTAAADAGPATITLPFCIIAENYPIEQLYAPDLRDIPIRMRIYPDMANSRFGTVT